MNNPRGLRWRTTRTVTAKAVALALVAAPVILLSACSDDHDSRSDEAASVRMSHPDSQRTLGPGDVRILTGDSAVQLALIGDTVFAGLGPKVVDNATKDMASDVDSGHGLGSTISRMVKAGVKTALGAQIAYPLSSIADARYENGRLALMGSDGTELKLLQHSDVNGKSAMESFSPDDSRRFVAAIKSRKGVR